MTKSSQSKVDPRNARNPQYKKIINQIVKADVCPLCPPMKWHPNPILMEDNRWLVTENSHPYPGSKYHFIFICKDHIEDLPELSGSDFQSILNLANWTSKQFDIKGGGLTMRFGETLFTGATIKHLHAHLIVPKVENGKVKPVYFPIG